jgi:hypothetical protein
MDPPDGPPSIPPDPAAVAHEDTFNPTTSTRPPPLDASSTPAEPLPRLTRPSLFELGAEVRRSILELPVWKPRWKPWSPARVLAVSLTFGAVMALLVALTHRVAKRWAAPSQAQVGVTAASVVEPVVTPAVGEAPRADAALVRERRSPLAGGLFTLPPAFHSRDGAYDLVIHFHGNTELVEESFELSGLNAAVVIMNLGIGSGPYEDRFANALSLPDVLVRAQATMEKRGLANAHLRRLALSAWSAGYGAVLKVLDQPALAAKVDAVLLLDGIHVGYQPRSKELILERLAPFERFAREAVEGRRLFSITHSDIDPMTTYAGTHETTDALLRAVDVPRSPGGDAPGMPALRSIEGVIAKKKLLGLVPESTAIRGGLRVRGYAGNTPEDHIAHLVHMSRTVLPELLDRWKE